MKTRTTKEELRYDIEAATGGNGVYTWELVEEIMTAVDKYEQRVKNLGIADISVRLSSSLGECVEGNDYEIVADKDGRFWINHKEVGSGEPLVQWIDRVLNVR